MNNDTSIFIFSSVGSSCISKEYKNNVFKSWELENFDSGCVIYNKSTGFPYEVHFKKSLIRPGFKFPNLFYFDNTYNVINNNEYICVIDDDLLFKQNNSIVDSVSLMKKFDIALCSLSNSNDCKPSCHEIMSSNHSKSILITNFVEMGCMIFRKDLLKLIKQEHKEKFSELTDFGFDWWICSLANEKKYNIGLMQHISYSNPLQPARDVGKEIWINKYKNQIHYIQPTIYNIVNVDF